MPVSMIVFSGFFKIFDLYLIHNDFLMPFEGIPPTSGRFVAYIESRRPASKPAFCSYGVQFNILSSTISSCTDHLHFFLPSVSFILLSIRFIRSVSRRVTPSE